ncbi:MAG: hypothetical protein LBI04_10390, partial [Treponema sp.]|nr:hypothetical protein [Treponema sp.]
EFIVLYNGSAPYPDYNELKLSAAFMDIEGLEVKDREDFPLELKARVYNINHGHNPEILKKSEYLDGYSFLVENIRRNEEEGFPLAECVPLAIDYCIENNKLRNFLLENSVEVRNMLITEYDRDMDIAVNRREAWEDGMEIGMGKGREKSRQHFLELLDQGLTIEEIKERLNQEEEVF